MKRLKFILGIFITLVVTAAIIDKDPVMPSDVASEYNKINTKLDYNQDVKPILSDKCFACHGPDKAKQKAGLRLDIMKAAYGELPESPGKYAIYPGNLNKSEVFHRIVSSDPEYVMPSINSHLSLTAKEKAILAKWIYQGAEYQPHWAFVKPKKIDPPVLDGIYATNHPIDQFVRAKLRDLNLQPTKKANKELLLRRLSLDIIGLPPTINEIDAFLNDSSKNAYEKQVDRLLKTPHYGERMASDWLDLARFADSHGYTVDKIRDMSPYRDWVIEAFNNNMPYDRFVKEQLAGDLMPNPTKSMIIATAFNRNHPQNTEGGIVEEEFQTEYVMDRTNTFGEALMAMSVGCARCHDHKYDPISQKNYYEMFSFFNNVLEAGQIAYNDDLPTPTLLLPTEQQDEIIHYLTNNIATQEKITSEKKQQSHNVAMDWVNNFGYRHLITQQMPTIGLQARFLLNGNLRNQLDTAIVGEMKHEAGQNGDKPVFAADRGGKVLSLDGDVYLDLFPVGVFRKSAPFSIGMWVWIPKTMKEGVIFHKNEGERLYNFKGFHVYLKNNRFEILMAHTAPSNAIIKLSENDVPREKWIYLTLTYDGSSRAVGFNLHQNGTQLSMEVIKDKLYKDIIYYRKNEPALQVGGWWRGVGFKDGKVSDVTVYNRMLSTLEIQWLANGQSSVEWLKKAPQQLSATEKEMLANYYVEAIDTAVQKEMAILQNLRNGLSDSTKNIKEIMVMEEMSKPKKTTILARGQYNQPLQQVFPNTPTDILPYTAQFPKNRLGLANWLMHEDHPLTSRVAVNRLWQQFFGTGLVKTAENFGNQGEMPSNQALLDWLAVTFRTSGWDIKKMIKLMVLSETYQQDSYTSPTLRELDPENRWLGRGPSNRLTAEMMRDNMLTASGLLKPTIGGSSFKPYQPAGLWEINNSSYKADSSDAMYRRSLYIIAKRSVPNPTMASFDASERSYCLSRRQKTNTPLQALVTLNDPGFIEAAKVLGETMSKEKDPSKAIAETFRKLTGQLPKAKELELLLSVRKAAIERFNNSPEKTKGWLTAGIYTIDKKLDAATIAANAEVASIIMNSDATITKR